MPTKYPHLMPDEVAVWERFLQIDDSNPLSIDYDVKVGQGITTPADMPEPFATNSLMLSKKRIDAVLTYADRILIVELKKLAGWTSIGQILGYPVLFIDEFGPTLPVSGMLIAESLTLDTQRILDYYTIPYMIV